MINFLITDYTGNNSDLQFIKKDYWLKDTEVIYKVYNIKGRWKIIICLIWAALPYRMVIKYMPNEYHTKEKAEIFANFYTKSINKNKRGKLTINHNDYNICNS